MVLKKLFLGVAASLVLLGSTANANIVVQGFSLGDVCSNTDGVWSGGGKVSVGMFKCNYSGTATVAKVDGAGNMNVDIALQKDKDGSSICPSGADFILPGSCTNGVFLLKKDNVNLSGEIFNDGKEVMLSGTVVVVVMGHAMTAKVDDMDLHKQ